MNVRTYCALRKEAAGLSVGKKLINAGRDGIKKLVRGGEDLVDASKSLFRKGRKAVTRGAEDVAVNASRAAEDTITKGKRWFKELSAGEQSKLKQLIEKSGYAWDDFLTLMRRGGQDIRRKGGRMVEDAVDYGKDVYNKGRKAVTRGAEDAYDYGKGLWDKYGDTVKSVGKGAGYIGGGAVGGAALHELMEDDED